MPGIQPRDLRSTDSLLDRMSGDGRVILTASTASEEAWEHPSLGHGYLTYHLLEALLGSDCVVDGETVRLLRVLDHVAKSVVTSAAPRRRVGPTTPGLRGSAI